MSNLQSLLEQMARSEPDSTALVRHTTRYSFSGVDGSANYVGSELIHQCPRRESVIAIWSTDPVMQVILTFGVWKAGLTATILDAGDAAPRLGWLLENTGIDAVITDAECAHRVSELTSMTKVLAIDAGNSTPAAPELGFNANTPALIIFTPGSDGRPKGVVKTHDDMLRECREHGSDLELDSKDRVVQLFPLNFASGLNQALSTVFRGTPLYFFDVSAEGFAPFQDWFRREEITVIPSSVALFRRVLHHARDSESFSRCRYVLVNGDRLFRHDVDTFRRVFPASCKLIYSYGTTECGPISRYIISENTPVEDPIPVGKPVGGKGVKVFRIRRKGNVELPIGEPGEIAVVSSNPPSEYWKDPEMTERKFRPSPDGDGKRMYMTGDFGSVGKDGLLYFHNRSDRQVKIQGYRIDLSEIEIVLNNDNNVAEAVVTTVEDNNRELRLVAYVALSSDSGERQALLQEVSKTAATRLPAYMLPDEFVILDAVTATLRGKSDEAPATGGQNEVFSETEQEVIGVWEKLFKLDHISLDDDLLDLDVSSLLAMEMCLVLGRKFCIEVPYAQLASSSTPRQLAAFVDSERD